MVQNFPKFDNYYRITGHYPHSVTMDQILAHELQLMAARSSQPADYSDEAEGPDAN